MFKRLKVLLLPLAILAATLGVAPNAAAFLSETRVGGYQLFDTASRLVETTQAPESQQANAFSWYDTASECSVAAKSTPQHVFWSGGRSAENAARSFAGANNGIVVADTAAGQAVSQATRGVPWSQARPQWLTASEDFARTASGEVNVFQNARGVSLDSIWRSEYRVLQQNPNVSGINYHMVMPDGAVVPVP